MTKLLRERNPETCNWVSCVTISDAHAGRYVTKVLRAHTVSRKNANMQDHGRADVVENRPPGDAPGTTVQQEQELLLGQGVTRV
jgi:hypothetical protein